MWNQQTAMERSATWREVQASCSLRISRRGLGFSGLRAFADRNKDPKWNLCHGLDKLWKWNVVCFGMFVMNDGALRAVKKLYVYACAQHVTRGHL
jgi:hypothetical protein